MLTSIHTLKPNANTEEGSAPRVKEYVERIGVVLFQVREDGIYVLMEHIDNPTDDLERRWKFPQGILDEHNKRGGFNGRNLLAGHFGLTESEAYLWEVGLHPITDPLKSEAAVLRKGFKRTVTTWTTFKAAGELNFITDKQIRMVPITEALNVCELSRVTSYTEVLAMVPDATSTPLH